MVVYTLTEGPLEAREMEVLFEKNRWEPAWRYGVFPYHHYHSTAHEVLGCYAGSARVQLGGPGGRIVELTAGTVVAIPAGVAHCNLGSTPEFSCVGAYPEGQQWDLLRGKPGELETARRNIKEVPLPELDPLLGGESPAGSGWEREGVA